MKHIDLCFMGAAAYFMMLRLESKYCKLARAEKGRWHSFFFFFPCPLNILFCTGRQQQYQMLTQG